MNKKLLLLGLAFILTMVLFPAAVLASSDSEINAAQKAAQSWVEYIASNFDELSQWKGAVAMSPQPYENLEGDVNAYMFTIAGDKDIVGYVLVGSSEYDYTVFEAGEVAPPAVPSNDETCLAIESLGVSTEGCNDIKPAKLLYLGLDNQYALYEVDGKQAAVNLVFKNAKLLSDLKPTLPSPSEYQTLIQNMNNVSTRALSGAGSGLLTMSWWTGAGRGWCGPCSGVSILQYYRDQKGYTGLSNQNTALYDYLYYFMDCAGYGGATMPWNYGTGVIYTTEHYNYYCFNSYLDLSVSFSDYECVVNDLISGWPTALLIVSEWHWRAIRGYIYDTSVNCYYVICTNSQTHQNMEYINWLTMGPINNTVCIKNNG